MDKSIERNNSMLSPDFEFPMFDAEEEVEEEIPDEISRLLKDEERIIQPHKEPLEAINLGSEEDKKEVNIGALLDSNVKGKLIDLLKEYVDVFAWSYQDIPGLDTSIVEHHLPLKPECPLVKQRLRRIHPDMADKIKRRFINNSMQVFSSPLNVLSSLWPFSMWGEITRLNLRLISGVSIESPSNVFYLTTEKGKH